MERNPPTLPAKKYHVALTQEQRTSLQQITRTYKSHSQSERNRARILLLADTNREDGSRDDETIAKTVKVCAETVENTRRRFATQNIQSAVYRARQDNRKARKLDGKAEAFLVATL